MQTNGGIEMKCEHEYTVPYDYGHSIQFDICWKCNHHIDDEEEDEE